MAKDLFNRYIWLVDTIYRSKEISYEEINEKWMRSLMSEGEELPLRTFHNHRKAVQEIFGIEIECNKRNGYVYYIKNVEDIEKGGIRNWLLNTFAVNNLINESHHLKHRILFEEIPSGQRFLTPVIEAMRDDFLVEITYQGFGKNNPSTFCIKPYCLKVFRQRWYVVADDEKSNGIKIYALDRVHALRITDSKFVFPKEFAPKAYFEHSFGIMVDEDYDVEVIKIKAIGSKRKYIEALPLHHTQEEIERTDSYSVFSYYLRPSYDFSQELLSHGSEIEVLSPDWYRKTMKETIEEMLRIYRE